MVVVNKDPVEQVARELGRLVSYANNVTVELQDLTECGNYSRT